MNMSEEQEDIVKQNIMNYCTADNIRFEDQSSKNTNLDWCLMINGKVAVYKQQQYPERIYFQSGINIASEHQALITTNNQIRNNILLRIPSLLAQLDVSCKITQANNSITQISLSKLHFHSSIKKADFLELYLRLYQVQEVLLNQLSVQLQVSLQQLTQNQQTPAPGAGDVGIG